MDYTQYKGKPFQVISKLQCRYSGYFEEIDQVTQTICLSEVYNHGTEDRPAARALPGSSASLGWVRFHTNSIASLALIENYVPPVSEALVDPILASVSQSQPSSAPQQAPRAGANGAASSGKASLPPKPVSSATSAMDRVQKSLSELSTDSGRRRKPQAPAVPDAEFDFTKGTERFQKERQAHKEAEDDDEEEAEDDLGEPESKPHPSVVSKASADSTSNQPPRKTPVYSKSSFFDNISTDSSRVSRAEERHRNFDTFGEAGGADAGGRGGFGGARGGRGGAGGGRGRRGGYSGQQSQGW